MFTQQSGEPQIFIPVGEKFISLVLLENMLCHALLPPLADRF
jgi:hypothetical protein